MRRAALDAGLDVRTFWELTFGEVAEAVESRARVLESEQKAHAAMDYTQAALFGQALGGRMPRICEAYPGMFPELERPHKQDWRVMKERLLQAAAGRRKGRSS